MDRIETLADLSIRRACGFAGLGVATVMGSLSFDALLCFRSGAILVALCAAVLWFKAEAAPRANVRRTELWAMLGGTVELPAERTQQVLGNLLRERYLWHATVAAGVACLFWLVAALVVLRRAVVGVAMPSV